jgi:hypothetical protein
MKTINKPLYKLIYYINIYKMKKNILHYPTLRTVLAVEKVLKEAELVLPKEEIKRRLPMKIMHQTLNLILNYLEDRGMVLQGDKGALWIYTSTEELKKLKWSGTRV